MTCESSALAERLKFQEITTGLWETARNDGAQMELNALISNHGTTTGYAAGCRCDECKAARRAYLAAYKAKKAQAGDYRHGTMSGYTSGCRCDECKNAQRAYMTTYRAQLADSGDYSHGIMSGYTSGCRCDECARAQCDYMMQRNYGLTADEYDAMLVYQGGLCASCGQEPDNKRGFHIDHDHDTGVVRSLLCPGCNVAFGFLREDPQRIQALLNYALLCASPSRKGEVR
ncbi:MAG: vBYenPAB5 [Arthrobacter sp.]|nr:vBYenPAB5 [Arthrobacter sp.]